MRFAALQTRLRSRLPTRLQARLEDWMERQGAGLSRLMPEPPFMMPLAAIERELADDILTKHRAAIGAAKEQYLSARARDAGRGRGRDAEQALDAIATLADTLVSQLRARMECIPRDRPLLSLIAWLDAKLPTDEPEHMDNPALDWESRRALIRVLDRATRRAGDYQILADLLDPMYPHLEDGARTVVLDLASGAGGFPVALARIAGQRRNLRVIATDLVDEYLEIGRANAREAGVALRVEFRALDAFDLGRAGLAQRPHLVTCTRTLHHFGIAGTTRLLASALETALFGLVFVDISRSISRLALAAGAGIASGNWRFMHDAVTSVRKSFTVQEMRIVARCVPGGESLEIFYTAPAYVAVRGFIPPAAA